jgi:hypothetical protein
MAKGSPTIFAAERPLDEIGTRRSGRPARSGQAKGIVGAWLLDRRRREIHRRIEDRVRRRRPFPGGTS